MRLKLELWMGLGKALREDFHSPSELRSELEVDVEEGMTVKGLFSQLAERYPPIAEKIFDAEDCDFYANVIVILNDRVISRSKLYEGLLQNGDRIKIVPVHMGG
jgi:sulfur carrier protein ThiS